MNKDSAQKQLIELGLLPLNNGVWKSFDVTLYSNSTYDEYLQVLKVIRNNVIADLGGVFIIKLKDEILFVGSSKDNLRYRVIRQMEKIHTRDDKRADFFKKEENQGNLTIYFSSEDGDSIKKLLKCVLQPKYDKWLLEN